MEGKEGNGRGNLTQREGGEGGWRTEGVWVLKGDEGERNMGGEGDDQERKKKEKWKPANEGEGKWRKKERTF